MPQLNISHTLERLSGTLILIVDQKHARIIGIIDGKMVEQDIITPSIEWNDRAGNFRSSGGGGISEEKYTLDEHKKRFFKEVVSKAEEFYRNNKLSSTVLMCTSQDVSIIEGLFTAEIKQNLNLIEGNYIETNQNEILKKIEDQKI
ncbi:hypothetical protein JW710_00620 [Candidatus Dojkabacteria bacterium]|nr:hypothetical protein [Candidatus Dojkabacteria bacterium]